MYIGIKDIIYILLILYILSKSNTRYVSSNSDTKTHSKLITGKDLAYWIVILLCLVVYFSSVQLYQNEDFTKYISFAGTVTSIILGVIAIIYSFFQSYDNSRNKDEIQKVYNDIDESICELKDNVKELEKMSENINKISEVTTELNKVVSKIEKDLSNVSSKVENIAVDYVKKNSWGEWIGK